MFTNNQLTTTGEYPFVFPGLVGTLEGILLVPPGACQTHVALLGHPHSLQGGTMNNKVVTTMVRAFKELGIPSLRFNFRGVGQSAGHYDAGVGESDDMLVLMRLWQQQWPVARFVFAGFSFGSYVAYRAAALAEHELLITIAPPVHHYDYSHFAPPPKPWFVFQGDEDEVVPVSLVLDFIQKAQSPINLIRFPETSHFFHGKLLDLKAKLIDAINQVGLSL